MRSHKGTMKSIIVYYSYSGNTHKVAEILRERLSREGEATLVRLKAEDESSNFFIQCLRAISNKRARIKDVPFNLFGYDLICLGCPVWAREPVPAIKTYLDKCSDLDGKRAILFVTYGSGLGKDHCMDKMENALRKKGIKDYRRFSISQFKVNDRNFVLEEMEKCLK